MIWTAPARADLADAIGFLAEHSLAAASRLLDDSERASESLAVFAERGRRVLALSGTGAREIFVGRYRLVYVIVGGEVRIRSFIHGARDWHP